MMKIVQTMLLGCTLLFPLHVRGAEMHADGLDGQGNRPPIVATDEYAFDSGFGTTNVAGYGAGGSMFWLNQFNVIAGLEVITAVRIAWGTGPAGVPAEALVFQDPNNDGNPTDITPSDLLASSAIVSGLGPSNTFLTYAMPNVFVGTAAEAFRGRLHQPPDNSRALDATDRIIGGAGSLLTRGRAASIARIERRGDGPLMLWDSINTHPRRLDGPSQRHRRGRSGAGTRLGNVKALYR